jgi:TonB family protein
MMRSPSPLFLFAALALCAAVPARAEDPPAHANAVQAPQPQGGGDGAAKAKTGSLIIEDDSAPPEAAPPAPIGEERQVIGRYIRSHTGDITECYERRLAERKTLQGRLTARFDIGPNGRVIGATAEGIGDRELTACVVKVIRGWEFEKPQSGGKLRVAYPWVFTPTPAQ